MKRPIDDIEAALWYFSQVKRTFGGGGGKKYRSFYTFLREFRDGKLTVPDLISSVKELLSGHDHLLQGFTLFLPDKYAITVNGDGDDVGHHPHPKILKFSDNVTNTVKGFPPKRHRQKFSDDVVSQIQQATDFANKVRERFEDGDGVYKSFLDALCGYKNKDEKISISQVEKEIKLLFRDHPDLLIEISRYTVDFYDATDYETSLWESMKKGKRDESYQKTRKEKHPYETMLFKCEDDHFEADVAFHRLESAKEKMELFIQDAKKTGGPITDLKEYFTPINLRCIEQLYNLGNEDQGYGLDMLDQIRKNPIEAGYIVLCRLNQKLEEMKDYLSKAEKVWAKVYKDCHEKIAKKAQSRDDGKE